MLCASTDASALWAYECLRARGLPIELVTAESLVGAHWNYRLGADGVVVDIGLADGRALSSRHVLGAVNRLMMVPPESTIRFQEADREYVGQEFNAFYISWLGALPGPVLNPPTPQGLCGRIRHISEWVRLASKAELPTPVYEQSSREAPLSYALHARVPNGEADLHTVFVVERHVLGGATTPAHVVEGCRRMAEVATTPLLAIEFSVGAEHGWTFAGCTTMPDLRQGGQPMIDALMSVFGRGSQGGGAP